MENQITTILNLVGISISVILITFLALNLYQKKKNLERSLNMVFLQVRISKNESKSDKENENTKDFKEEIAIGAQLYDSIYSIYSSAFKSHFIGQDFFALEYVVIEDQIYYYFIVPSELAVLIEKQITGFYPDAYVEIVDEYNIFRPHSKFAAATLTLSKDYKFPLKTYQRLSYDPTNYITNALSKLNFNDGAAIQIMLRPHNNSWQEAGRQEAKNIINQKKQRTKLGLNPINWLTAGYNFFFNHTQSTTPEPQNRTTPLTDEEVKAIEEKNTKVGYETIIRVITSANTEKEAKANLTNILSTFAQYSGPNYNGLMKLKYINERKIIENFIYRSFKYPLIQILKRKKSILSTEEIASIFHLPDTRFNKTPNIVWQNYKVAPVPPNIPKEGLLLGHNHFRGVTTEIRMKREDRFRHFYVIGQTGTGKSSILQTMIRQDLRNGEGLCIVDPHGQLIEDILPFIPKHRADDVIYFNPSDVERPMGLNMLEGETDDEKEQVSMDTMNIMIKLFGDEIFGPRIQDYFRNGCLTLMADPAGGALTDIVRLFTDDDFQRMKVAYVKNPVVRSFWEDQMAKTGAREKQEMIPYFAAKFGQFITNTMMRNIIGQTKSGFDFMKVMQEKKILLMNLSKGEVGEVNSKLLGLIIVSKFQMAALRRQRFKKEDRQDFFMYIDEFQNYITDSIESILSEARKYRLSLNMAHQYIAQLEGENGKSKVKDAVFGNVGTMMCYKVGASDAEYLAKEMSPVFSEQDLINIDKYKAVMKLSIDTQPSRPFSITPLSPYLEQGDHSVGEAFRQLSRLKYGRDREIVEREIIRRIGIVDIPTKPNPPMPNIFGGM